MSDMPQRLLDRLRCDDTVASMQRGALESISEAVLAIAAEREVEPMLRRLVRSARELAGARYAALGIPDGEGAFAQFITAGMSDELIAAMGPLPRLVAARAPADALVPRRADPGARKRDRSLLPDRQGRRGRVLGRGSAADRDAGRSRRGGDRERAAAGAQPRAEHCRGAQPP